VLPAWFPGDFDAFVDRIVPELQRRGLFRRDYAGATLREHLGIAAAGASPHERELIRFGGDLPG